MDKLLFFENREFNKILKLKINKYVKAEIFAAICRYPSPRTPKDQQQQQALHR